MKKLLITLTAMLFISSVDAAIIQVNNNAGTSADYALLQQAIDAANNGDTLYVAGSPNYYDGTALIRLNKTLTIIGPGYFLGENGQNQSSNQTAKISEMEIGEGASNSVVMGMDFLRAEKTLVFSKDKYNGTIGTQGPNGVAIKRNIIYQITLGYSSGTVIEQNYFSGSYHNIEIESSSSNTLIQNNIMIVKGTSPLYSNINGSNSLELSNTIIKNNVLSKGIAQIHGVEIINNIILGQGIQDCDNNILKNNVFVTAQDVAIPTESTGNTLTNNVFSVTATDLFIESTLLVDNDYMLKVGSPASGAGLDGIDAGAFGGLNAYKLSGLPPIPSVYELTTNGIGTKENGLGVTLKAKSNN